MTHDEVCNAMIVAAREACNWHKRKGCFLLSSYKEMKSRKGWTATTCETDTCTEQTFENQIYKFNKNVLISRLRAKTVSKCLDACNDQVSSLSWK